MYSVHKLGVFLCAAIMAGCASAPATHVERDPTANLHAYKTFAFYQEPGPGRARYSTIAGNRIKQSTREQLQQLGYVYDERSPELRVNIVLNVDNSGETIDAVVRELFATYPRKAAAPDMSGS